MVVEFHGKNVTLNDDEIAKQMASLGWTKDEVVEMMIEYLEVDRMPDSEVDNDLTAEQKKVKREMTQAQSDKKKRKAPERKPDEEKIAIISDLCEFFEDYGAEDVKIENKSKILTFKLNNRAYKIDLIAPRPKK